VIADGAQFKGSVDMDKGNSHARNVQQAGRGEQVKPMQSVAADSTKSPVPQQSSFQPAEKR